MVGKLRTLEKFHGQLYPRSRTPIDSGNVKYSYFLPINCCVGGNEEIRLDLFRLRAKEFFSLFLAPLAFALEPARLDVIRRHITFNASHLGLRVPPVRTKLRVKGASYSKDGSTSLGEKNQYGNLKVVFVSVDKKGHFL